MLLLLFICCILYFLYCIFVVLCFIVLYFIVLSSYLILLLLLLLLILYCTVYDNNAGTHTLRVSVQYTLAPHSNDVKTLRKFYRFNVLQPLIVLSSFREIGHKPMVQCQVTNATKSPIYIDEVGQFVVITIITILSILSIIYVYMYIIYIIHYII